MKIGNRVVVNNGEFIPDVLVGKRGIIVDERIPESQMAMLCGIANFVVKLDEPVDLKTSRFSVITLPSNMLKLEREVNVV
jgi:hypothetical protein